jgi:hypothetical protein
MCKNKKLRAMTPGEAYRWLEGTQPPNLDFADRLRKELKAEGMSLEQIEMGVAFVRCVERTLDYRILFAARYVQPLIRFLGQETLPLVLIKDVGLLFDAIFWHLWPNDAAAKAMETVLREHLPANCFVGNSVAERLARPIIGLHMPHVLHIAA